MKIILSPSKLQNPVKIPGLSAVLPSNSDLTQIIKGRLMAETRPSLSNLLKIKGQLLDQAYGWLHDEMPKTGHAVATYTGIVFKEITANLYDSEQRGYLERHFCILSAYYGVLTPFTVIGPYRLDMTIKFEDINLYDHWRQALLGHFSGEDLIVNLASKEYSQLLDRKTLAVPILDVDFKEEQSDGTLRIVTVHAKQARGLMVHYMIENLVENPESIKHFCEMGYNFDEDLSSALHYVFVKRYENQ